jgi:hypothetical protein
VRRALTVARTLAQASYQFATTQRWVTCCIPFGTSLNGSGDGRIPFDIFALGQYTFAQELRKVE